MELLNQTGPEFLKSYLVIAGFAVGFSFILRALLRPSGTEGWRADDPYQAAYVRDGAEGLSKAVLASLLHRRAIDVDVTAQSPAVKPVNPLGPNPHPAEDAAYQAARAEETLDLVRKRMELFATNVWDPQLIARGVLVSRAKTVTLTMVSAMPMVGLLLLGATKIFIGVERGKPVGFLAFAEMMVVLFTVLFVWLAIPRSTRAALNALRDAQHENSGLRYASASNGMLDNLDARDVAWAVALFGLAPIMGTHLAVLPTAYSKASAMGQASSGGCSSGGGGCGGGCGGGGCGGCGG